jgi:hypothetical protein
MTDDKPTRDFEGLALRAMANVLDQDPDLRELVRLTALHDRELYLDILTLADLDRKRKAITLRLTFDLAPDVWWVLLETRQLPDDFDAWASRDFETILHQAGISSGLQVSGPIRKTKSQLIRETKGADKEKWKQYTRRAYHDAATDRGLDPKVLEARGRELITEQPALLEKRRKR